MENPNITTAKNFSGTFDEIKEQLNEFFTENSNIKVIALNTIRPFAENFYQSILVYEY